MNVGLKPQLERLSTEYLTLKGVDVVDGYVGLKELGGVLCINGTAVRRYAGCPECIEEGGTPKVPVSHMLSMALPFLNRGVKSHKIREALREYLDFIGVPYLNVWHQSRLYIVYHAETDRVKIGVTDTPLKERVRWINKFLSEGEMQTLLVLATDGDVQEFESAVTSQFVHLSAESPMTAKVAGWTEWYRYDEAVKDFIKNHKHVDIQHEEV